MEKPRLVSVQQRRGRGLYLWLSGVLALGGIGKARNMGNVSSCCINAKRGFRLVRAVEYGMPEKPRLEHLRQGGWDCRPGSA